MTKIRITAACLIAGIHREVGDVVELSPVAAAEALSSGRCEVASGYNRLGPAADVEHRDPATTDRDPKGPRPATKRGKKAKDAADPAAGTDTPDAGDAAPVVDAGDAAGASADQTDPAAE